MYKKISKFLIMTLCIFLCFNCFTLISAEAATSSKASAFSSGADIGWVSQLEADGISWVNDSGDKEDPLKILKDKGVDSVRLRVFVNPPANGKWTSEDGYTSTLGYCDEESVVTMAKRAKKLGFKIMIDFHYSDYFADPSRQDIPASWANHSLEQLQEDVYQHTYKVMSSLAEEKIYPEWVQIGNETNQGMLWPYGYIWGKGSNAYTTDWTKLINKGYSAVKEVSSSSKVVIHLANGEDNALFRNVFDSLEASGAKYDVIGMSYYPYWEDKDYTETIDDLAYNLKDMASRYNKEVMVCEVGGLASEPTESYNLVKAVIEKVKAVPSSKGIGVFYWEPCAASTVVSGGYPLGACTEVKKKVLKFTDAINAFQSEKVFPNTDAKYKIVNRLSGKVLDISGGSSKNGAELIQSTYSGEDSQKWELEEYDDGYYIIKNVDTGKVIDVLSKSKKDGATCAQWKQNNGKNQQWKFIETEDSYYTISNRNSSKILDVSESSTANGASVIQWADNGGWNQQWIFVEVD